jgi:hypothetical protein
MYLRFRVRAIHSILFKYLQGRLLERAGQFRSVCEFRGRNRDSRHRSWEIFLAD